jgi:hypothetical protein
LEKIMTWPAAPATSAVVQPCQTLGNLAPSKISTRSTIIFSQPLTLTDWLETDRLVCIFIVAVKRTRFQTVPPSSYRLALLSAHLAGLHPVSDSRLIRTCSTIVHH